MESIFIEEIALAAVVPAAKGLYPEIHYKYKPALMEQRAAWAQAKDSVAATAKLLAAHVSDVRARQEDGSLSDAVQLSEETAKRLKAKIVGHMVDRIMGQEGPTSEGILGN